MRIRLLVSIDFFARQMEYNDKSRITGTCVLDFLFGLIVGLATIILVASWMAFHYIDTQTIVYYLLLLLAFSLFLYVNHFFKGYSSVASFIIHHKHHVSLDESKGITIEYLFCEDYYYKIINNSPKQKKCPYKKIHKLFIEDNIISDSYGLYIERKYIDDNQFNQLKTFFESKVPSKIIRH